jgi:hypothetical protein
MCKDCNCGNNEDIKYESSVEESMNRNVVTITSIKGQ